MRKSVVASTPPSPPPLPQVAAEAILSALATAVVVVNTGGTILYVNETAQSFLRGSAAHLR